MFVFLPPRPRIARCRSVSPRSCATLSSLRGDLKNIWNSGLGKIFITWPRGPGPSRVNLMRISHEYSYPGLSLSIAWCKHIRLWSDHRSRPRISVSSPPGPWCSHSSPSPRVTLSVHSGPRPTLSCIILSLNSPRFFHQRRCLTETLTIMLRMRYGLSRSIFVAL